MIYIYGIKEISKRKVVYVGSTSDISRRMKEHLNGKIYIDLLISRNPKLFSFIILYQEDGFNDERKRSLEAYFCLKHETLVNGANEKIPMKKWEDIFEADIPMEFSMKDISFSEVQVRGWKYGESKHSRVKDYLQENYFFLGDEEISCIAVKLEKYKKHYNSIAGGNLQKNIIDDVHELVLSGSIQENREMMSIYFE